MALGGPWSRVQAPGHTAVLVGHSGARAADGSCDGSGWPPPAWSPRSVHGGGGRSHVLLTSVSCCCSRDFLWAHVCDFSVSLPLSASSGFERHAFTVQGEQWRFCLRSCQLNPSSCGGHACFLLASVTRAKGGLLAPEPCCTVRCAVPWPAASWWPVGSPGPAWGWG